MKAAGGSRHVTLADVAREAGVSHATASRAVNGSVRKVRPEYRSRVLAAAERLGYVVNPAAQAMARGRSDQIALLVNGIHDDYFSPVASGVLRAAEAEDRMVTMVSGNNSVQQAIRVVASLRAQRPRAIILAGGRSVTVGSRDERLVEELLAYESEGGRVVAISEEGLPFDTVALDNRRAGFDLADALADLGYREFAVLAGPPEARTAHDRVVGFREGLERRGVPLAEDRVLHCAFDRDGGYAAAGEYLLRHSPAQVVLAISDTVAVGAMARFREAGLRLPQDLAVAGIDDVPALRDVAPALTTVRLPWGEVGRIALDLIARPSEEGPRVVHRHGHVVLRRSTPPPTAD
ncbi:LacI family DNA-binding transcriptional regulator [Nocardiopsis sp. MG754419]|uniref:LacI family DNA-binding transcriptional regulator n=1 Tax=Nocardiopsis sp. MG754419 TaxID=2259865 RepID=UPI001BAE338B|nr:LacI family DNA-binding transcriptional regulator [Nocardiopsis sp. MG754419]MBR8742947.1 LacI family transcriptional regulator [Nocardiopsis sp. MG754419]